MELSLQKILAIPAVRAALRQEELNVEEDMLRQRVQLLDQLKEVAGPLGKAQNLANTARDEFEAARKAMEVARGKLGNAEQKLNEVRARESAINKRLHALGEGDVEHALYRINSIVKHYETTLGALTSVGRARTAAREEVRRKEIARIESLLPGAREAHAKAMKLRHARISPVELADSSRELMLAAGIELPDETPND